MIVSKDTFHYKLVHYVFGESYFRNSNVSLCKYFWTFVISIILGSWMAYMYKHWPHPDIDFDIEWPEAPVVTQQTKDAIALSFVTIGAAFGVLWLIYGLIYEYEKTIETLIMIGIVAGAIIGFVVGLTTLDSVHKNWRRDHPKKIKYKKPKEREYEIPRPREPNMFLEWLKARKKKMCPLLRFVDESEI